MLGFAAALAALTPGRASPWDGGAGGQGAAPELEVAVHALVSDHAFKDAEIGVAILDIDAGRFLAVANEHAPLNPASNAKLYTAAAALATTASRRRSRARLTQAP